jgi:hypothetical protein
MAVADEKGRDGVAKYEALSEAAYDEMRRVHIAS